MATTVSTHVSDFVLGLDDSKSADIARDLYGRNISLVEVVESLGEYLTSANVDHRRRGTRLMAEVLQMLPSDFLPDKEVDHVSTFLLAKLSDHHSIQPWALHALAAVSQCAGFCDGDLSRQVCRDIFREVHNQSLAQADRRATYTVFYNLLTLHLSDLLPLGDSLVCGYVQQMDGEKDPRNLMLAFRCSLIICHNFALGPMEEEMFEVNSCYFPVDFVPPPNDAHGISREDLSQALSAVMSATPVFAKYCFPLLLEKLSSDVPSAKMDSLKTLGGCLTAFDPKDFHEFIEGFSAELIKEVRAGSSEDLVDAALQALTAVAAQVSQVPQQLQDFMAETGANLVRQVESDNQASRLSATRTLCAMAAADGQVCHAVASRLLPAVCAVCHNMSSQALESDRMFFTEVTSLLNHVANAQNSGNDWGHLQVWGGRLVEMSHTLLASPHPQLQALGMKALSALFTWGAVFTAHDILLGIDAVISRALQADNDRLREESRKAVSQLVQHHPQLSQRIIASFNHALQSNLAQYSDGGTKNIVDTSASLLAAVAVDNQTGEKVCHAFSHLLQSYSPGHEEVMVPVSSGLSTVLSTGHLSADFLATDLLPSMLGFLWPGCGRWPEEKAQLHQSVLSHLAAGWRHALSLMDQHVCQDIVSSLVNQLINGYGGDDDKCSPLQVTSPWQQTRLVQLLLTVIPRWDGKGRSLMAAALSQFPQLALWTKDPVTHLQACRCLAALLNHMPPGSELESSVKELRHNVASNLSQCVDLEHQKKALNLLVWVTKAMVVRGHRLSAELTCQLTDALSDPALGTKAAEGFPVILEPFPHLLCTSVGATVAPAFQQRFLVHSLPSLLSGFRSAHNEGKENYQLAMVGMLTYVPQQVLVTELPQLMPVLVSSLNGSSASLLREALSAVTAGLQHTPQLLTSYLSDILPQCLTLATAAAAMAVRIMAVRCVGEMIHLPATATQPHKMLVLRALKPAIDDPKRLVRKEAVKARTAWCLL